MAIAEKDVKWVQAPELGLSEMLYLPTIFSGLVTTIKHMFKPKVTQEFPEKRPGRLDGAPLPAHYRGVHRLNRDEQGRVKCVACYMCSTACPAHCIDIVAAPSPWPDREKYPATFVIDELRCIYCGMCEQACPVDAIELTTLADLTGLSREEMIFDKEKLLSVYDETTSEQARQNPANNYYNPVRTQTGRLGVAAELPPEGGATTSSTAQS